MSPLYKDILQVNCSANKKTFKNIHRALCIQMRAQHGSAVCVQIMYDMHGIQNCIPWHDHAMCKEISKKTSFVPFAVKLVVCASFKGDAHCAKMCGCIHTSFGGCARGAEQAISISSVDDIVHAKSYAFQKACLSHHPLMMSCIQRAMPIVHTFKALMCQSVHVQKCSPPWDARHPSRFSHPEAYQLVVFRQWRP